MMLSERMLMRLASTSLTAVATATALAATSTLTPVASAEESQPATSVQSGYVTWSIKDSFLRYIQGPVAKGTVEATDGLETVKDGKGKITNLKFPVDTKNTSINAAGVGTIDLDGAAVSYTHVLFTSLGTRDMAPKVATASTSHCQISRSR